MSMPPSFLEVTYRHGKPLVAYLQVDRRPGELTAQTEERDFGINVDYAEDGRVLGVEFVAPSLLTRDIIRRLMKDLRLSDASTDDLAPLVNAVGSSAA